MEVWVVYPDKNDDRTPIKVFKDYEKAQKYRIEHMIYHEETTIKKRKLNLERNIILTI